VKTFITNYRRSLSALVGDHYGQIAADRLRRTLIGLAIMVVLLVADLILLFATPMTDSVAGTTVFFAVALIAILALFTLGARWNGLQYRIRRDLRAAGYTVRRPADIRGAGVLKAWMAREDLTPAQVAQVGSSARSVR